MAVTIEKPEVSPDDFRANLTDEIFQEMTANPDSKIPFLVNWEQLFLSAV